MKRKYIAIWAFAALSVLGFQGVTYAQQEAQTPAAAATDTPEEGDKPKQVVAEKSLADMWRAGGVTMYPLGLCAILSMSLIVYNFINVRRKVFLAPETVNKLQGLLNELRLQDAIKLCEDKPSPITNIIGSGLARINEKEVDINSIERAMEEASTEELAGPYILISYLSVIASISPMLGLYGTVSGMVKAFNTIAAEGAGSAQKLADNIAEALITTAAGMIVGIPSMFFFFFFKTRFGKITSSISRIVGDLTYILHIAVKFGPQDLSSEEAQNEQK